MVKSGEPSKRKRERPLMHLLIDAIYELDNSFSSFYGVGYKLLRLRNVHWDCIVE
jgi:hypothetical protein